MDRRRNWKERNWWDPLIMKKRYGQFFDAINQVDAKLRAVFGRKSVGGKQSICRQILRSVWEGGNERTRYEVLH